MTHPTGALTNSECVELQRLRAQNLHTKEIYYLATDNRILSSDHFLFNCWGQSDTYYFRNYWHAWAFQERVKQRNASK